MLDSKCTEDYILKKMLERKSFNSSSIYGILKKVSLLRFIEDEFSQSFTQIGNKYRTRCPFHDDSMPSFFVYDNGEDKPQTFHCFSCQSGSNIYDLIKKYYKFDDVETSKFLKENYRRWLR